MFRRFCLNLGMRQDCSVKRDLLTNIVFRGKANNIYFMAALQLPYEAPGIARQFWRVKVEIKQSEIAQCSRTRRLVSCAFKFRLSERYIRGARMAVVHSCILVLCIKTVHTNQNRHP